MQFFIINHEFSQAIIMCRDLQQSFNINRLYMVSGRTESVHFYPLDITACRMITKNDYLVFNQEDWVLGNQRVN